ncbi:MAG: hypothetical protein Q9165_001738 [Trypethelium subeluteriae]
MQFLWRAVITVLLISSPCKGKPFHDEKRLVDDASQAGRLAGIPTVPFSIAKDGQYHLASTKSIVVDSRYAGASDDRGQTLIPPTLKDFASTFAADLRDSIHVNVSVSVGQDCPEKTIFLTIGNPDDYTDAAGRQTSEGYSLSVSSSNITITGASPLGVWWGTRTVLQQAALSSGGIPYGSGVDSPGWGIRGMMLDAGRHYYPPEFLTDICSYMSFFKQNTFHVHLSDNLYNNVDIYTRERSLSLYARFRLWSDSPSLIGLNKHKNESYTREQFDQIQSACAARGVTVVPEIEAPGHALVIVQWKPELGLQDLSLLNISQPDTIPTMELIWNTFLDWFHTKTVHVGADEYTGPVNEYNTFVNTLSSYVDEVSNKSIRIWGTFPPNYTEGYTNIYKNVSVQHWEYFEDDPYYDYILNGYSVVNSDDAFYVVNKYSESYPQTVNLTRTFHGNPNDGNGLWYPYIFNINNSTDNPARSNALVLGEIGALWNDYGPNASVYSEAYYAWREGIPALADKQWGGNLTETEFSPVFSQLHRYIPAQNLDRSIPSKSPSIVQYSVSSMSASPSNTTETTIHDASGNGYDAETSCSLTDSGSLAINPSCSFTTPLSSKGRNYTLTISLVIDELQDPTNATIISGTDSSLMLTPNITLFASGNYYRLNSSLPLGKPVDLAIVGKGNQTFARVSGAEPIGDTSAQQEFLTQIGINGEYFVWAPMAIEAPLRQVGGQGSGWTGELLGMNLTSEA